MQDEAEEIGHEEGRDIGFLCGHGRDEIRFGAEEHHLWDRSDDEAEEGTAFV